LGSQNNAKQVICILLVAYNYLLPTTLVAYKI
jgi:hypothetical protein